MKNLTKKIWKLAGVLSVVAFMATVLTRIPAVASPIEAVLAHYFFAHSPTFDGVETLGPWTTSRGSLVSSVPNQNVEGGSFAAITVPVSASYEVLTATGAVTLAGLPTFATTYTDVQTGALRNYRSGALLIVVSTNAEPITFQDNGTLTGSDLFLSSQTVVLEGPGAQAAGTSTSGAAPIEPSLQFQFNASLGGWQE